MDQVDEIKHKLDIVQVVGEYVQLKKAGLNWKGRCPFHNEKSPSFFVNEERQFYHCFGCNESGDVFTFVQKMEGLDFPEALRLLAGKAGVELVKLDKRVQSRKNRLFDICEAAAARWHKLINEPEGAAARKYIFEKRKMRAATVEEFRVGYAPASWDATMKFLLSKGFLESEIFEAGLLVKKEKGSGYYDRFRDRVTFPINDLHGNVIGFSARALAETEAAKYINTSETPLYKKGAVLFAMDKAKRAIREKDYVIIVEGNMDAISCHEAGYKNVVACSGTALTAEQIRLLKRYSENVKLCLDQDEAGQLATRRSIDLLWAEGLNVKIVMLKDAKDPDECLKKNPAGWVTALKNAIPAMQFYFDKFLLPQNLTDGAKKKKAVDAVLIELAKITSPVERDFWLKRAAELADVTESTLRERLNSFKSLKTGKETALPSEALVETAEPALMQRKRFNRVLSILMNFPQFINLATDFLPLEFTENLPGREFYKNLIILYNASNAITCDQIINHFKDQKQIIEENDLLTLSMYLEQAYAGFKEDALRIELLELMNALKVNFYTEKIEQYNKLVECAKKDGDKEAELRWSLEISKLIAERGKYKQL